MDLPLPASLWPLLRLAFYSSPFWTAALWLTWYLLPDRSLNMLTTGIFLVFTATLYALFRILRQHMYRLKANSSPNWIAWHLLALLFLTIFPSWYCLRSLQPACQWLSLSPDIAAIPSIIIGWLLTRRYRILP